MNRHIKPNQRLLLPLDVIVRADRFTLDMRTRFSRLMHLTLLRDCKVYKIAVHTMRAIENIAGDDPDHDWRLEYEDRESRIKVLFQRQNGEWVLINSWRLS